MSTTKHNVLQQQLNILIAGNNREETGAIANALKENGYSIRLVNNGKDAIQSFHEFLPDILVLDESLSIFDGLDVVSKLKKFSQDKYIPVVMLSNNLNEVVMFGMAASGVDDIFVRPFNLSALVMKVELLGKLQLQVNALKKSYQSLSGDYAKLQHEYDAAERLFLKLTPFQRVDLSNVKYHMSPQALSNGDIFLCEASPVGDQYFLLGDFAGHGLAAAMGACSIKEYFAELVRREAGLPKIVDAINDRLTTLLPPELFSAACLLHYKKTEQSIDVWNGGMPAVRLYNNEAERYFEIHSDHPPLGIDKYKPKNLKTQTVSLISNDHVLLISDGLIEARDKQGNMFGAKRVRSCVMDNIKTGDVYDKLYEAYLDHRVGKVQSDDVTLIEIRY